MYEIGHLNIVALVADLLKVKRCSRMLNLQTRIERMSRTLSIFLNLICQQTHIERLLICSIRSYPVRTVYELLEPLFASDHGQVALVCDGQLSNAAAGAKLAPGPG